MKVGKKFSYFAVFICVLTLCAFGFDFASSKTFSTNTDAIDLEPEAIEFNTDFDKMMSVVMHPRCMNCHPSGDRPAQGEDSHEHYFEVQRGEDDRGVAANRCETCHLSENNDLAGVPGAPHWQLAPRSMGWQGLNRLEVSASMLDLSKNGGKSLEAIRKHLTEDALVLWAFNPGVDAAGLARELPPISKEEFIEAVNTWVGDGGSIPTE